MRAWWLGGGVDPARAAADQRGLFADYAGQSSWSALAPQLRAIEAPVAVVTGPATAPHVVAAADAVAALMPHARRLRDGDAVAAALALL